MPRSRDVLKKAVLILQATDEDAQIIQLIGVPLGGHSNAFSVAFGGKADIPFCTMSALTQSGLKIGRAD